MALYLLIALIAVVLYVVVQRQRELFCISVRHGEVLVLRGRVPPMLLGDFRDALSSPKVRSGTLRAVRDYDGARLLVSGSIDEYREQRLRNIFRLYPLSNLRSAPPIEHPSLGQVMGVAWLAWMLTDRRP